MAGGRQTVSRSSDCHPVSGSRLVQGFHPAPLRAGNRRLESRYGNSHISDVPSRRVTVAGVLSSVAASVGQSGSPGLLPPVGYGIFNKWTSCCFLLFDLAVRI